MNKFHIVVTGRNAISFLEKCLQSCVFQNFPADRFIVTYGDDQSTDGTYELAKKYETKFPNFKAIRTPERLYQNLNISFLVKNYSEEKTILVSMDADDWFPDKEVLNYLDSVYNENVWMTYGRYVEHPYRDVSMYYRPYSDEVIINNTFRKANWLGSHLRTFRRDLYLKINEMDFYDEDGKPFKVAGDLAMMFPMLEMSGFKSKFTDKVLYVYNVTNPLSDNKESADLQLKTDELIRNRDPYTRIYEL